MSAYTERETKAIIEEYDKNPCLETVERIAIKFNRPKKSIIAKLVKEGAYITRGYRDKKGEIPVTKISLVRDLEELLDIKLVDLDKAPKPTLKLLLTRVQDLYESSLSVEEHNETIQSLRQMLQTRGTSAQDEIKIK